MSDETPTERLTEANTELAEEKKKSNALLIALIAVGALLLVGLIVVIVLLLSRPAESPVAAPTPTDSESPTPTPTPTESESPTPTPTPTPEPTQAPPQQPQQPQQPSVIVSYTVSTRNAHCADEFDAPEITFNWNTTGSSVSFGIGTQFAEAQPYQSDLPPVGGTTINYQCSEDGPDQIYSIAVIRNGNVIGRETITVRDN